MESQRDSCSGQALALAFLFGALVGAIAGMFLAPWSGEKTRRTLKAYAKRTEEDIVEKAREVHAALDEMIERGKHFMEEKRADVGAAVKSGKDVVKERREKCCS